METISSMAQTAAKAVWGDGAEHDEPVSGVQGDVSKGEPYDGGNIDPEEQERRDSKFPTEEDETLRERQNTKNGNAAVESTTDMPDNTAHEPATSSTPGDDKQGVMGDGPKSLDTVAKEHGGDAGNIRTESESTSAKGAGAGSSAGAKVEDDDSESKGTGEQYVKTTGLAADGGDFDATKPGAGREADRLMEAKGIDHVAGGDHSLPDSSSSGSGTKDGKPSLKERIKDKLHIHKS